MAIVIPEIPIKDKLTLTVPEASALSGIPYKIVNSAVKSGDLESCHAGSSTVRIRRSDLEDWVAALPDDWC
ncbi:MAG: helix-turn-helix domain-containing protein [Bifidobacterium angulatum]